MNTFLHEIVISFFPTKASCAFVGESWFFSNHIVRWAVLRVCESQCAHLIQTNSDEYEFEQHVLNLVADNLEDTQTFVVELVAGIPGGDYLLTRGWFCRSEYHQANVLCLRICGCLDLVNPIAGDFDEHIQSITERLQLQREINSLAQNQKENDDEQDDIETDDEDMDYSDRIIVAHVMIDGEIVGLTESQLDSFIQDQQNNSRDHEDWWETDADKEYDEPPCQIRRMNSDNYTTYTEVYDDDYDSNAEVDDADAHYGYVCYEGSDDDW
jgi:hypothetical protein